MKIKQYIFVLMMFGCGMSVRAQEPGKQYVTLPVQTIVHCEAAGMPYVWRGQDLYTDGTYRDTVKVSSWYSKDTIYTVNFSVAEQVTKDLIYQMPKGGSIILRDTIVYKQAGTYYNHVPGPYCDTIERIIITYAKSYDFFETKRFCGDSIFWWHGIKVDHAGSYQKNYLTHDKVDSIYHLMVYYDDPVRKYEETRYGCKTKVPYMWNGLKLFKSGDTTLWLKTKVGCDSIVTLHLKLMDPPARTKVTIDKFCASDGYFTHGMQVHTEALFTDTFPSYCGCDSIVDTIIKPYPNGFFKQDFMQHYKGETVEWRGKQLDKDTIIYDTLPNKDTYGCYQIYQLRLVTKYDIYHEANLCYGEQAEYISPEGKKIITTESHFIQSFKSTQGGDSIHHFDFYFQSKEVIHVDSITICGNEQYTWEYDEKHKKVISGGDYHNQKVDKVQEVEMKLGDCRVAKMIVTVKPYYQKDSLVIMCNEDAVAHPFIYIDHNGHAHEYGQPNMDETYKDVINSPQMHTPGQQNVDNGCDSIISFRFISTSHCSEMDSFPLCSGDSIYIDRRWYKSTGTYHNVMQSSSGKRVNDSTHFFTIYSVKADTLIDTVYRCESEPATMYYNKLYNSTRDDTIHITYAGQSCDSLVIFLHVETKSNRMAPIEYFDFCSVKDIYVATPSGKVFTTPGYHTDTIVYPYEMGCDSILQYYISIHPVTNKIDTAYIRPNSTYKWTCHGKDSILTEPGIYVDRNQSAIYGCDSTYTLVLNLNEPYYEYTQDIACSNHLPYVWRGKTFYASTHEKDTIYDFSKDSIFELDLTVSKIDSTIRKVALLPGTKYEFYNFTLQLKDTGKIFSKTFPSMVTGCDSIEQLVIVPVQPQYIDTVLCPKQYIIIGEDTIQDGYSDTTCVEGSYSVRIYTISHSSAIVYEQQIQIAKGETYVWQTCSHGTKAITEAGTYLDSCQNKYGCDSIIRLKVVVAEPQYKAKTVDFCYRDLPYIWHGQEYYTSGTYTFADKTKLGQNYIDTLHLNVIQAVETSAIIDTCYNGYPISFKGHLISNDFAFVDTTYSLVTHCDSIVHYLIRLHHAPAPIYENKVLEEGKTIKWRGQTITTSGVYIDTIPSVFGCDSITKLIVTVCPAPTIKYDAIYGCSTDVIRVGGKIVTTSGVYDEVRPTADGCEEIRKVQVTIATLDTKITQDSLFPNDVYRWKYRGQDSLITKAGIYRDTILTKNQLCDSIHLILVLTNANVQYTDTTILLCNTCYMHKQLGPFCEDGVFIDTIRNKLGKDSIYNRCHYHISKRCSDIDTYYLCPNETKRIDGLTIRAAGEYSVLHGNDSLYRFTVLDAPCYADTLYLTGCDSIIHGGRVYKYRGTDDPFVVDLAHKSMHKCDSLEHLVLTIHSSKKRTHTATIADYEKYVFEGKEYNTPGTHQVVHTTRFGCDSIEELELSVLKTEYKEPEYHSFCKGDPSGITIFNKKYFLQGDTIIKDTTRLGGNNPIIQTAIVTMNLPFEITEFTPQIDQYVCASEAVTFYASYKVKDNDLRAMPTYYRVDFKTGDLDAYPRSKTYPVNGKTVIPIEMDGRGLSVNPGYYSFQITFGSDACKASDTKYEGSVLVRYPADIMESNWDNVVALVNEKYNAGRWVLQPPYAWQVWDEFGNDKTALVIPTDNVQPFIGSNSLQENDVVVATLYRSDYLRPVPSCPFIFQPVNYNGKHPIVVYPTAVNKSTDVHVNTAAEGRYMLYNETGNKCRQGAVAEGDNTLQVPASTGCYLLQVNLQDGTSALQKLIVY